MAAMNVIFIVMIAALGALIGIDRRMRRATIADNRPYLGSLTRPDLTRAGPVLFVVAQVALVCLALTASMIAGVIAASGAVVLGFASIEDATEQAIDIGLFVALPLFGFLFASFVVYGPRMVIARNRGESLRRLDGQMRDLREVWQASSAYYRRVGDFATLSLAGERRIVEAIAARDPELAREIARLVEVERREALEALAAANEEVVAKAAEVARFA